MTGGHCHVLPATPKGGARSSIRRTSSISKPMRDKLTFESPKNLRMQGLCPMLKIQSQIVVRIFADTINC